MSKGNEEFEIETDMPMPARTYRKRDPINYPFGDLEISQSFFAKKTQKQLRAAMYAWRSADPDRIHLDFAVYAAGDGARCWRVEDRYEPETEGDNE